jgi:hypothetical protein
LSPI